MRRIFIFMMLMIAGVTAFAATYGVKDIPNVHVADRTRYVSNPDGILSPGAQSRLDAQLAGLWDKTSAEVVVVIVDQIDGDDIDGFATRLFSEWGIGKKDKDNGLLFLISKDDRRMAIRTGYGMEGVVPDILAGRIIRNFAAPRFKEGDFDGGVIDAVGEIERLATTPGATEELMSKYENDRQWETTGDEIFTYWLVAGTALTGIMLLILLYVVVHTRKDDRYNRYHALKRILTPALFVGFIGLGIPFVAFGLIWLVMRYMRVRKRVCPNCHHKMHRLPEDKDNAYLTPQQDVEERINSVDYDVWLCDNCGETDILPFVNQASQYQVCPRCGARAESLRADRIVVHPTQRSEGKGVKIYGCRNCGYEDNRYYNIPKVVAPPVVIIPGGGRGGGFGGGGFSGGSFGGGMTGGGGASGGW
ncbi:MAG: TPM domain-containing protein [Muribaculum sp.]|nr:TPM domain-containing protein [Muribaculum sp.]